VLIDGLLALDSDVPVVEIDETFTQRDRDRFKGLFSNLGNGSEEVADTIKLLNDKVRKFERREERLKHHEVFGVLDWLRGTITITSGDAVLVSRLRRTL
jgi:hypothetical protein